MTCVLAGSASLALAVPGSAQSATVSGQGELRFAYVNSERIMAEAPGAQAAREALDQQMQQFQAELQQLEQEISTRLNDFQQKQVMMSPEAKQTAWEEIGQMEEQYNQRRAEIQRQAAERRSEVVGPIMRRINAVITAIREEEGYAMIFDTAQGALVAADPSLDITDQVLERLRAQAEATASNGN